MAEIQTETLPFPTKLSAAKALCGDRNSERVNSSIYSAAPAK
jgi:hypothetical protein